MSQGGMVSGCVTPF